jgi:hypothetical protein
MLRDALFLVAAGELLCLAAISYAIQDQVNGLVAAAVGLAFVVAGGAMALGEE